MQNSMVVFSFFVLDGKHPFWANLLKISFTISKIYAVVKITRQLKNNVQRVELWELAPDIRQSNS